jgi:carbon-monoxide dehydrogenase medium subunit
MYSTALRPGEIITRVEIPVRDDTWKHAFDEVSRRHGDYALAALALAVRLEAGDVVADARVVFAGVEAHPRRVETVEAAFRGQRLSDLPQLSFESLDDDLEPVESVEYPGPYRVRLAATLLRRLTTRLNGHHDRYG